MESIEDELSPKAKSIEEELASTRVGEELARLRSIYGELEQKQKEFCSCFDLRCPEGCGSCCRDFTPDITELEADFLAYGLIAEGLDGTVLEQLEGGAAGEHGDTDGEHGGIASMTRGCPFFREQGPYHCTVYKWRPLVCRLFGAAASTDKNDHPVFRHCKWNPLTQDIPTEELEAHRELLVLMNEYGLMLEESDPDCTERLLIPEILPRAIRKVRMMLEFAEAESGGLPQA